MKQEVDSLDNKLVGSKGTNKAVDQLNIQIKNYQDEIDELQQKIDLYNQTDEDIKKINDEIATLQSDITQLNLDITTCTDKNDKYQTQITDLNGIIKEQDLDIKNLQEKIKNNIDCPRDKYYYSFWGFWIPC